MEQFVARAGDIAASQRRLRRLLRANREIAGELSRSAVLERVLEAARDLSGARRAAVAVLAGDGSVDALVQVGMDEGTVAALEQAAPDGSLPGDLSCFLQVPIRVQQETIGRLFLADPPSRSWVADDEELLAAVAATAGIAMENARLYEESGRRQAWLRASAEIAGVLHDPAGRHPLDLVAESMARLADASLVAIVVPAVRSGFLKVAAASGEGDTALRGLEYGAERSMAQLAMSSEHGMLLPDEPRANIRQFRGVMDIGPAMMMPLVGNADCAGALVVMRKPGEPPFHEPDLELAESFARDAAVALELIELRDDQQRLAVLEDRDRIARDLHDHVIQRLHASGLSVQSIASQTHDPRLRDRLTAVVEDLRATTGQIRTSIHQLREDEHRPSVRSLVLSSVQDLAPGLESEPVVQFQGAVDAPVTGPLAVELCTVLHRVLVAAQHAGAQDVRVEVAVGRGRITLRLSDDGALGADRLGELQDLLRWPEQGGASLTVQPCDQGCSQVVWSARLPR